MLAHHPLPRRRAKRLFDVALSLLLIGALTPVYAVVLVAMAVNFALVRRDAGPFFYAEPRISHGRRFGILKFRTIRQPAIDAARRDHLTTIKELEKDEANLTWSGRFLKNFYVDELPQLFNILMGDMTFVGPRPWPEEYWMTQRSMGVDTKGRVPCGLTGPAQVAKRHGPDDARDVQLDLDYIEAYRTYSVLRLLAHDVGIMCRSVLTVVDGKGI